MSENCNHDCSSCGEACASRDPKSFLEKPHAESSIRKVIGVVSGKGGVGKSMVSSLLAANFQKKGYHTAVMDADITGPSIPKAYGINEKATGDEHAIYPVVSKSGIQVMSVNLLLEDATDPVIWRGPVIAGTVKQFWQDVVWKDVDYMFVDMPPGTGDVPLTVFQSLPLDGIIASSEPAALGTLYALKRAGLRVPQDVKIVSFDSTLYSLLTDPPPAKQKPEEQGRGKGTPSLDLAPLQMLRTKQYWLCAGAVCFSTPAVLLFSPIILKLGMERGLDESAALWAVVLGSVGSAAGRLLMPLLSDKIGRRPTDLILFGVSLGLSAVFLFARGWAVVAVYAGLTFCYSALAAVLPALSTDLFGLPHAGVNYGFLALGQSVGSLLFPCIADFWGFEQGRHILAIAGAAAGFACIWAVTPVRREPQKKPN